MLEYIDPRPKTESIYTLMTAAGFLLSETHLLVYKFEQPPKAPVFFTSILLLSTIFMAYLMIDYALLGNRQKARGLQLVEYIGLPMIIFLVKLLLMNEGYLIIKIICIFLLMSQCMMVCLKIIYFGPITDELAHIWPLIKLLRVVKLNLLLFLPILIPSALTYGIIFSVCQLITAAICFYKITFTRAVVEYYLTLMVIGGLISSCDTTLSALAGIQYNFLAQLVIFLACLAPRCYFGAFVEIKYRRILFQKAQAKSQQSYLVDYLFTRECIFVNHRSLPISLESISRYLIAAVEMIQIPKDQPDLQVRNYSQETAKLFRIASYDKKEFYKLFFKKIAKRFKNTHNFECLEFLVNCALDLKGRYIEYALISYYRFTQDMKSKSSSLERCRYEQLYNKIMRVFPHDLWHAEQIKFIQLSEYLKTLQQCVEQTLEDEISLFQFIISDDRKTEIFPEQRMLKRHENKKKVNEAIKKCQRQDLYIHSNSFKYYLLLYGVSLERSQEAFKEQLKQLLFSNEVRILYRQNILPPLVVMKGFNAGQITHSNGAFRSNFELNQSAGTAATIADLFPSISQKNKHLQLMEKSVENNQDGGHKHIDYECVLVKERQLGNLKFRSVETYKISTRIYYEYREGFNYVCQLQKEYQPRGIVCLLKKQCQMLEKRGFQIVAKNTFCCEQLGEQLEIWEIQINVEDTEMVQASQRIKTLCSFKDREKAKVGESFLDEKMLLIENKLNEQFRQKKKGKIDWWQFVIVLMCLACVGGAIGYLVSSVNDLTYNEVNQLSEVRLSSLARRRIQVEKAILNLIWATNMFPASSCSYYGIPTFLYMNFLIEWELGETLGNMTKILYGTDRLLYPLVQPIFSPTAYLPSASTPINYLKLLGLHKAVSYRWMQNHQYMNIDFDYYSTTFPNQLLYTLKQEKEMLTLPMGQAIAESISAYIGRVLNLKNGGIAILTVMFLMLILLRIKENLPFIAYYHAIESIPDSTITLRVKELRHALDEFKRFRNNGVQSLDIDSNLNITLRRTDKDKKEKQLNDFMTAQKMKVEQEILGHQAEEDSLLLTNPSSSASKQMSLSYMRRILSYNKVFIMAVLALLAILLFSWIRLHHLLGKQADNLNKFIAVQHQLFQIDIQANNLVAYNWIKVVALEHPINMALPEKLQTEALNTLRNSKIQQLLEESYSAQDANKIMYQNICEYFAVYELCIMYRDGIFKSGLSVLLPMLIKEEIETKDMSTNYTHYWSRLCDKTNLLLMGINFLTRYIPERSLQIINASIAYQLPIYYIFTFITLGLLAILTTVCLCVKSSQLVNIREQALTMDSVSNLYKLSQFKPYFNQVYYS